MNNPNPKNLLLWTMRRNERDVVELYNYLSELMQVTTGGDFLNFGYWDEDVKKPTEAQKKLCKIAGDMAEAETGTIMLDVGSGFSEPARMWEDLYHNLEIVCINTNRNQLKLANKKAPSQSRINLVGSTSTKLPISSQSVDRIIALESPQHFKPISEFISEVMRVLKNNGMCVMAIPIVLRKSSMLKMGILEFTWSSEHYTLDEIKNSVTSSGMKILEEKLIGEMVYPPLAQYYFSNRKELQERIAKKYPRYLEKILYRSMIKMKELFEEKTIEYVLIKCAKPYQ